MAKLEIYGWLLETSWGLVPKDQVNDVIAAIESDSFDRDDFEDILEDTLGAHLEHVWGCFTSPSKSFNLGKEALKI